MSEWHPDIPLEYRNAIVTGDARVLAERIPDESVGLVICDPVYWWIDTYAWLARMSERILRDGGAVVAQVGTVHRYDAETAMRVSARRLTPRPLIAEIFTGGMYQMWQHRTVTGWRPFIWFTKGERSGDWVHDCIRGGGKDKGTHEWGDSAFAFVHLIERLTSEGATVYDPFTGGGTVPAVCKMLGRNYIASEIDPDTAERARERVLMTQPPLFVQSEEQGELWTA